MDAPFFDSHAHLSCPDMWGEIGNIIHRAEENQIKHIVNIATDDFSLQKGLQLSQKYPWIYLAGATTPHDVEKQGEKEFSLFEKAAKGKKLIAIGETGLDYHYEHSKKEIQKEFCKRYMELASKENLPIIFHCREAFEDLFSLTDQYLSSKSAILHCFTGNLLEAKEVVARGWAISFSGIITFPKSENLRKIVYEMPLENILIETDSPYLAPQSKRGKQNEPSFVTETAKVIAQIKKMETIEIAQATFENALRYFQIV